MASLFLNPINFSNLVFIIVSWIIQLTILPLTILTYKKRDFDTGFISLSKFISCIIYSTILLAEIEDMYLTKESWLRLALIFTTTEIFYVLIYLMDLENVFKHTYRMYYFGLALIVFEPNPENTSYTYGLIIFALGLFILSVVYNKSLPMIVNQKNFSNGIFFVVLALTCNIIASLIEKEEENWYASNLNSFARALLSVAGFFLIQRKTKPENNIGFLDVCHKKFHAEQQKV